MVVYMILFDFGVILGLVHISFKIHILLNSFPGLEGIAKIDFSRKSFFMDVGVDLCRFLEALGAAFLFFFGLEDRLENRGIFIVGTDPETVSWRGRSATE